MTTSYQSDKQLLLKLAQILSQSKRTSHYHNTLTAFCKWLHQQKHTDSNSQLLHEFINNKDVINSIINHFRTFECQITNVKKLCKKPPNHTFNNFFEILNKDYHIADSEERIEHCLIILINITETNYFKLKHGQIRSVLNRENNNLFTILASIFNHCKLYRLHLSNKLFRFLQQMLPPINTNKSKTFCRQFDIPILLDRCCEFLIYRMHIDGDGEIDASKNNYNCLYGIQKPLPEFIDSVISIITYFINSKWHKFEHQQITPCIITVCVRLCHEIQTAFDLKKWKDIGNLGALHWIDQTGLENTINAMKISFKKNEYIGHCLIIEVAMEYLYYYSLKNDISLVEVPLGDGGFESFDDTWREYQYVIALLRMVTNNKILGLYLDTIANKMGYCVNIEKDVFFHVEKKKKK
eukprot:342990_1